MPFIYRPGLDPEERAPEAKEVLKSMGCDTLAKVQDTEDMVPPLFLSPLSFFLFLAMEEVLDTGLG